MKGLLLAQAAEAARTALRTAINPIDDARSTASYRQTSQSAKNVVALSFA